MKVLFKTILALILATTYFINAQAAVYTINGINYTLYTSKKAQVEKGNYVGAVNIPSTVSYNGETYTVTYIGEYAFQGSSSSIKSLTLPNTIERIDQYAFSGVECPLIIPASVKEFGAHALTNTKCYPLNIKCRNFTYTSNSFEYVFGDIFTYRSNQYAIQKGGFSTTYGGFYTYESCLTVETESYIRGIMVKPQIKTTPYNPEMTISYAVPTGIKTMKIDGNLVFYGFEPNQSCSITMYYSVNGERFTYNIYAKTLPPSSYIERKTQRTLSINPAKGATDLTTGDVTITKFKLDGVQYEPNDTGLVYVEDLIPGKSYTSQTTIYYDDNKTKSYTYEENISTESLSSILNIVGKTTSSSINVEYSFEESDAEITSSLFVDPFSKETHNELKIDYTGLEPNTAYNFLIYAEVKDCGWIEVPCTLSTDTLKMESEDARIIKLGEAVFVTHTNLDVRETNVGFEWRRLDWDDSFKSNHVSCYLFDETMEGSVKNVSYISLWKYRPYYQSRSGEFYYGNWVSFDPSNTSFYEPIVHTYPDVVIDGNKANIKVYVMNGSEAIITRGVRYWKEGSENDYQTVTSKGVIMDIDLVSLEYSTKYKFQAFAETEDDVYLGEIKSFETPDGDPSSVINISASPKVVTIYNINGQIIPHLKKGINLVRDQNGIVTKILSR